jgi:hypothetical protein
LANGTLPTAASKLAGGSATRSSGAATMRAAGCSSPAMRAEVGSRSTPVQLIGSPAGAAARNAPAPQPGSRTWPPSNPRATSSRHAAAATVGVV